VGGKDPRKGQSGQKEGLLKARYSNSTLGEKGIRKGTQKNIGTKVSKEERA